MKPCAQALNGRFRGDEVAPVERPCAASCSGVAYVMEDQTMMTLVLIYLFGFLAVVAIALALISRNVKRHTYTSDRLNEARFYSSGVVTLMGVGPGTAPRRYGDSHDH
jgi:hypothetical protein